VSAVGEGSERAAVPAVGDPSERGGRLDRDEAGPSSAHRSELDALVDVLRLGNVALLSGAGLSTDSGIPDYRGATGAKRRPTPMTYQTFVGDPLARRRYWARSHVGWPRIRSARPNTGHLAVAALQRAGFLSAVITQNVDGLHQAGGAQDVIELHGALADVICLSCRQRSPRADLEARLTELNPDLEVRGIRVNPDGDADLPASVLSGFRLARCRNCGSDLLKPDVVFFGENVPPQRVRRAFDAVEAARALLVVGSSLTVFSGYRFVRAAARAGRRVGIVNLGPTRGDPLSDVRLDAPLGTVLPAIAAALLPPAPAHRSVAERVAT
jgi:NAD-dependent SIR2 family protein deacetylase